MSEKILNENINRLNISCDTIEVLKKNNIIQIKQLCRKSKTDLRNLGLNNKELSLIEIELQLLGFDLKSNF